MVATTVIIPVRNKEKHVARCVKSFLDQTVDDFELVISDQGSEDNSRDEIWRAITEYKGKKRPVIMDCPDTEWIGTAGLMAHLNWLHEQITGDLVIMCSADDYVDPRRVKVTRDAFEKFNPSYLLTRLLHATPEGQIVAETSFPDRCSRWIAPAECFKYLIGSSGSSAWARDLYEKHKPLKGIEGQDMVLPILGLMERGIYYVDDPVHTYVMHADLDNQGLGGQLRAATDERHAKQLQELSAFHYMHHWVSIWRRLEENGWTGRLSNEARNELVQQVMNSAANLAGHREMLTLERIEPLGMKA